MAGARVLQHLGRNVAGVGAAFLGVAILAAGLDRRARQDLGGAGKQRRRHADQRFGLGVEPAHETVADRPEFVERGAGAVHFPVAGDERANSWRHGICFSGRYSGSRPSLPKSGHKAIDSGPEGRYCACFRLGACENAQKSEVTMLGILRNAAGTWVAKLLLCLLVLSFARLGHLRTADGRFRPATMR